MPKVEPQRKMPISNKSPTASNRRKALTEATTAFKELGLSQERLKN